VSRAVATVLALGLIGGIRITPGSGALTGGSRAAAADCTWQRHSKRVVKRVKRDGRVRRVVRQRHWWSCGPPPAPAPAAIATPPVPAADPAPAPLTQPDPPAPTIGRLSVRAEEWALILSNSEPLDPGEVIVELNNEGSDPHDLRIQREGDEGPPLEIAEAGPKERRTARFALASGTYQLWCSLPEHKERGMSVTLQVKGG
jgi:hypothetical protein